MRLYICLFCDVDKTKSFILGELKFSEQCEYCPNCGKEKENQTKCQSCILFPKDLQRNCRQAKTSNESSGLLTSNHNSGGQKFQNTGLSLKRFYGSSSSSTKQIPMDITVNCDDSRKNSRHNYLQTNGKNIYSKAKVAKTTNLKEKKTNLSDLNDPSKYFTPFNITYISPIFFTYFYCEHEHI